MYASDLRESSRSHAFTIVELLVVLAIVCVLAAMVLPAIARAKAEGKRAVSISNLRQCGMALLMYADEHGGLRGMPRRPEADRALEKAPTCDLLDYFRPSCGSSSPAPMIGSYAYVRDDTVYGEEKAWAFYLAAHESAQETPVLLINLFASTKRHRSSNWFGPAHGNPHPDRIQTFQSDGSARLRDPKSARDIGYTWQTLFFKR